MTTETDDDPEPVYWFCNSCGEEADDCCPDGEIEPSWDEGQP